MAADHFCLRWNNYQSNMVSELDILRTEEYLVDVSLCCEGHKFTAHKVILSACSPYFRNVFKENPCEHPVVILKDVSPEDVEALLSFIYQGVVYISEKKLSSFLQTAELLQIKGLAGAASSLQDETAYSSTTKQNAPSNGGSSPVKRRKSAPVRLVKSGEEGDECGTMETDPSPNTDDSQPATEPINTSSNDPQVIKSELMSYDHSQDMKQDEECSGLEEEEESENGCSVDGLGGSGLEDKGSFYLGQVKPPQSFTQQDTQSQICPIPQQTQTGNTQLMNSSGDVNNTNQFPATPPSQVLPENVTASGERNGRRPCPLCTKVISNKSNLLKHMRIRHSDAYNPACCVLCNKIFKNKYSLRAHLNIYHKEYINPGAAGGGGGQVTQAQAVTSQQTIVSTNQGMVASPGPNGPQAMVQTQPSLAPSQAQVQANPQVTTIAMQQQVANTNTLAPQLHLQAPPPYQALIHSPQQTNTFCIKAEGHTSQLDLLTSYIK